MARYGTCGTSCTAAMVLGKIYNRIRYFGDQSSLHGVRYILSSEPGPWVQRIIWIMLMAFCSFGMMCILNKGTELFNDDVISFIPETTYLHWETDFPAVTVCEAYDSEKISDFYSDNDIPNKLTTFYKEIVYLDGSHYCRSCSECDKIGCPQNIAEIFRKYRSPCNETLVRCSWRGQEFDCCEKFKPIDTEYGGCFVFNSALNGEKRMHLSNKLTGPGYLKFAAMESIIMDIHSPHEVIYRNFDKPIINNKEGDLPFGSKFELKFKVEETNNDEAVRQVPAKIRRCLFPNERHHQGDLLYGRYSYSTCTTQCRAMKQLEMCNCTHYMLPRMGNESLCDINGLNCLTEITEKSSYEDVDIECGCLPSCEEPNYTTILIKKITNNGVLTEEMIEEGTLISIYMECLPSTRVKRLVVRSSLDYVVFVGGTAGVFFGASILSILEIVYLIFIRKY